VDEAVAQDPDGGSRGVGAQHVAENHQPGAGRILEWSGQLDGDLSRPPFADRLIGSNQEATGTHVQRPAPPFLDGPVPPKHAVLETEIKQVPLSGTPVPSVAFDSRLSTVWDKGSPLWLLIREQPYVRCKAMEFSVLQFSSHCQSEEAITSGCLKNEAFWQSRMLDHRYEA
jgi:hypothetical protein